ncbi:MAG: hypothetical protein ACOY3V_04170 [Pseudomonadota bacterium]
MTQRESGAANNLDYLNPEKNGERVLSLFKAYYGAHNHTGALYDDSPNFFLFKPDVLAGVEIATRNSEKILLEDCVRRAKARRGYIGVSKHRNPKLGYYWLELSVLPFMLGDAVTADNKGEFFHILTKFIEYTKANPKVYGDLTAEIDSDKDLALMFDQIHKMADRLGSTTSAYSVNMLVSYNVNWPVTEVKKLMQSLKDNDQEWCDVFFEYLIYVMSNKARE